MDPIRDFSCKFLQNTLFNAFELDDMHVSLPNLKYSSLFLLNLFVAWLVRSCYI